MTIMNNKLNVYAQRRQDLLRKYDKKEIGTSEFNKINLALTTASRELVQQLIKKDWEEDKTKEKNIQRKLKMEETNEYDSKQESNVEDKPKKIGKTVQSNSTASLIGKALESEDVKSVDDVVTMVKELKPEVDDKKIASQTKTIIREAVKGKGRWAKYTWDEEKFLLTKKE